MFLDDDDFIINKLIFYVNLINNEKSSYLKLIFLTVLHLVKKYELTLSKLFCLMLIHGNVRTQLFTAKLKKYASFSVYTDKRINFTYL